MADYPDQIQQVEVTPINITDPSTPDFFANMTHVSVGRSDITIFFGRQLEEFGRDGSTTLPLARITLTHDHFIKMVEHWNLFRNFLVMAYGEQYPSLSVIKENDPERFTDAVKELENASERRKG